MPQPGGQTAPERGPDSGRDPVATTPGRPHPARAPESLLVDSTSELDRTRDSLADATILEQLAEAHAPAGLPGTQAGDALDELTSSRTAALDLTTYAEHHRVRYYLGFFQGPGRARMAVWLTRLPAYAPMIRERLRSEGLPEDLLYLALIESGYSNVAVSRSR